MRAQNNQSGGGRPMSPQMQKRLQQTQVGKNLATAVNKLKPETWSNSYNKTKRSRRNYSNSYRRYRFSKWKMLTKAKRIIKNQKRWTYHNGTDF